ncbi:MAG: phosphoribosylformylglycinamidine synthase I [Candidatus Omnitrophica bacterium]|nr:phosphoribosylformylglycinamidine synthase I [Candidatus Omnitrophota bacterium]
MKKPKVLVLRTAGTNCNEETAYAFGRFGADVTQAHVKTLTSKEAALKDFHIFALSGGFSYGDDIASGRILANELRLRLGDDLRRFIRDGKLIIGICNGFQILAKAGILPGLASAGDEVQEATLFHNDSGKFEARWTHLSVNAGQCVWAKGMPAQIYLPVAHGEGKFIPKNDRILSRLKANGQIVFRYCAPDGSKPSYPDNPNGSIEDIAGICDPTGRVLGLMPHPERHFAFEQHPFWTRLPRKSEFGGGAQIFQNGIDYVKKDL